MTGIEIDRKIQLNLNSFISIAGLLSIFIAVISTWNTIGSKQDRTDDWIAGHEKFHLNFAADIKARDATTDERMRNIATSLATLETTMNSLEIKMAQIDKVADNFDGRLNRVTESYSNQFADMRTQLNAIATSQALTNQTLSRIEGKPRT